MSTYLTRIADDIAEMKRVLAVSSAKASLGSSKLGFLRRWHLTCLDLLKLMAREHRSQRKVFVGIVAGAIVGTTPLFGLHLIICILVASVFRLNKFLVYLAANISIPPFIPFLAFLSIQFAHTVLHGAPMPMDVDTLHQHRFDFILYWAAGALPVGAAIGVLIGGFTLLFTKSNAEVKSAQIADFDSRFLKMTQELQRGFLTTGRMAAGFAKGKSAGDPVYKKVLGYAEQATSFIDIGGGQGLLSILIAGFYPHVDVTVADYDLRKLDAGAKAARALGLKNIRFVSEDVFAAEQVSKCDLIACIDVLHYQPVEDQIKLVSKMANALPIGGQLVIRDMDGDRALRTFFTVLQERMSLLFSLTIASQIVPRSGRDLVSQLEAEGFRVTTETAWGVMPFSNTLFIARKIK
jgi:uncharacterized protein (DUF2062 family)/2-polyprenyl-3-methyl-5-hydroxy-6-metoxy-1,4-benzoquinol methylase